MPLCKRALDGEISTLDITKFSDRVQNWLPPERIAAEGYEPDAIYPFGLLPLGHERRGEERERARHERSPTHYSIT